MLIKGLEHDINIDALKGKPPVKLKSKLLIGSSPNFTHM